MYNNEKYARQCIESVIDQTYKDIEILIIDDGSVDKTAEIINSLAKKDNRIKYYYQKNSGVSVPRNHGIEQAKGDFIMFVDGDDTLKNSILEVLYKSFDERTDIVSCCCEGFDDKGAFENHFFSENLIMRNNQEKERLYLQLMKTEYGQPRENNTTFTAIGVPWGKLYRKSFLDDYNLRFNPAFRRFQDNIFNMYCFEKARTIKYLNLTLYNYRLDHITGFKLSPEAYYQIIEERRKFLSSNPKLLSESIIIGKKNEVKDFYLNSIKVICNTHAYHEAKSMLAYLSKKELYFELLSDKSYSDKKFCVVKNIVNHGQFWCLYIFIKLKCKIL
jgi:glycosyltransferase involved in cell wall biosynthesis